MIGAPPSLLKNSQVNRGDCEKVIRIRGIFLNFLINDYNSIDIIYLHKGLGIYLKNF